jgi:hypothetical protein
VAVVASRLLPVACRALSQPTSRDAGVGGLGGFLAVRHLARRPGGVRTTMVLITAFALAGFAVAAWAVNRGNDQLIAGTEVGAPAVLTVSVPPGPDLGAVVDRVDPGGHLAAAVDRYTSLTSGTAGLSVLGVRPGRFARVAYWNRSFAAAPLPSLAAALAPPAPPPVTLTGDAVRVTVRVRSLVPAGAELAADVVVPAGTGLTPVSLGRLPARGTVTLTGQLAGCPCTLHDLTINLAPGQAARRSPATWSSPACRSTTARAGRPPARDSPAPPGGARGSPAARPTCSGPRPAAWDGISSRPGRRARPSSWPTARPCCPRSSRPR